MKSARHALILELIDKYDIETQDDLALRLREQGVSVTQATVSRDIKELRLIKVLSDNGAYKYATVGKAESGLKNKFRQIFAQAVVSITLAGNLVIIKTLSGTASAASEAIDSFKWDEIAGTLAGDNTIFVAVKDIKAAPDLIKRFHSMLKPE
ncbi:MAG TPA: arginine repressor [Clostridia bacterium]|nr:arginine repressor [Clostridia bacterium]